MNQVRILWVDDEIDTLKPHIIFLQEKGYEIHTCSNGTDAIDMIYNQLFDIVFLDEHMPGLSGLESLKEIKNQRPGLPVVMITKSEEEDIMEKAIGSKIADYLIKPVKPNQIILTIKKILEKQRLVTETTTVDYQSEFRNLSMRIMEARNFADWTEVYKKLVFWNLELGYSSDSSLKEIHKQQEAEANQLFSRFISKQYGSWLIKPSADSPQLSHQMLSQKVFPLLRKGEKVFLILIDNMRYDQWRLIYTEMNHIFRLREEVMYSSILPTATQYARNALFSGMMPLEIQKQHPQYWVHEEEEGSKNQHEEELLKINLQKNGLDSKCGYEKVKNMEGGRKIKEQLSNLLQNQLTVVVYNFVDMLSHARSDMEMIRELANDEAAYRSLTLSWFRHSELYELIRQLAEKKVCLVITTDHGTMQVQNPVKVIGDRDTTVNLRYKAGRNLNYNPAQVFEMQRPEEFLLPRRNISSRYIFARNEDYLLYPNNYNHFVKHFRSTFQHGGISMHEMIIPLAIMNPIS